MQVIEDAMMIERERRLRKLKDRFALEEQEQGRSITMLRTV